MELLRINKFLADSGCCSRRKAEEFILAGKVKVNNKVTTDLSTKIDPTKDTVHFFDSVIKPAEKLIYYALYKPVNVISSAKDDLHRKTVLDLVPDEPRVYPVGRLDYDSEGLIILTNDGDLTLKLTHPSFEHEKEYRVECKLKGDSVKINKFQVDEIKKKFLNGLIIDGIKMTMDEVEFNILASQRIIFNVVMHEGKNRQIRKMCAKVGLTVAKLTRIRIGKLELNKLKLNVGQYKTIIPTDIL